MNNDEIKKAMEYTVTNGPVVLQNSLEEFQGHVNTLLQRIDDLFDADPLLSLMGAHYEFKLYVDAITPGNAILNKEYGASFSDDMMSGYKEFLQNVQAGE